jgi:hypothetical protein
MENRSDVVGAKVAGLIPVVDIGGGILLILIIREVIGITIHGTMPHPRGGMFFPPGRL